MSSDVLLITEVWSLVSIFSIWRVLKLGRVWDWVPEEWPQDQEDPKRCWEWSLHSHDDGTTETIAMTRIWVKDTSRSWEQSLRQFLRSTKKYNWANELNRTELKYNLIRDFTWNVESVCCSLSWDLAGPLLVTNTKTKNCLSSQMSQVNGSVS